MSSSVSELGEARVLERILTHFRSADNAVIGPGDDCAVLMFTDQVAVTSDTMIEGPDFRLDWHHPKELGWKLAATNLSDVAAMGARPVALTVSFACPGETDVALLEGIAEGLQHACDLLAPGCAVVGGDLATAGQFIGAVTALGDLEGVPPVTRSGARPGHTLAYAGQLGLSRIGLRALQQHGVRARDIAPVAVRAHLTPSPPIPLGRQAAVSGASAMMDVSDGLSLDASRIAHASRVTIDLHGEALSHAFGVQEGVAVAVEDMVSGGEDHGLLATFPSDYPLPEGFHAIGRVTTGHCGVSLNGAPIKARGWDPFTDA